MSDNAPYLMGIDGGGTKCRAVLCDHAGRHLGSGYSGAANISSDLHGAHKNIHNAAFAAVEDAGISSLQLGEIQAFLGLAGANGRGVAEQLLPLLPFKNSRIVTDAIIALQGALGDDDGAVAILGTGSVFIYRTNGVIGTAGGRGFMVGDLGSGARLGRSLLQESLLVYDGIRTGAQLVETVLTRFEHDPLALVEFAQTANPGEFGEFAPMIFDYAEKGDANAQSIIAAAVRDLEETLAAKLDTADGHLCLLGGLGAKYLPYLAPKFRAKIIQPKASALEGAIQLAMQRFNPGDTGTEKSRTGVFQ